jgi:hypothetical protein
MDWLKDHIHEVILPNLQGDLQEATGITLDETLGEFKIVADPLDDDEDCEEFEITIALGDLLLVDACFLMEEVESGVLPFCRPEEELTQQLIDIKLKSIKEKVLPLLREEFVNELTENSWDPKLAHLLNIAPEVLPDASGIRSSGGYPPIMLVFRHPDYDPDAFEVTCRVDPMANEEWVDWKTLMPKIDTALKAIGEEQAEAGGGGDEASMSDPDREPTAEELADEEINDLEAEAAEPVKVDEATAKAAGNLLESLSATLGIDLTGKSQVAAALEKPAKGGKKKAASKKAPAKKKAAKKKPPAKKAAAKKKAASKKKAPAKKPAKGKKSPKPKKAAKAKKPAKAKKSGKSRG